MATPSVLAFDAEGRAIDFEVWVDDLQLFLQCDRADGLSLFDLTSDASPAPAADADPTVRSQWATRNAAARLAVRRHLPTTERAHFSQYKSAQTLYNAVVARYSSPATAALSRLMLPYLFPDLAAFPTVADLITHLRTSDTRYRAALPAEFCAKNPPHVHRSLLHRVFSFPLLPSVASAAAADLLGLESVGAASALAGDTALARARWARARVELAGAVEVAVAVAEGLGVAVGVVVGVVVVVAGAEAAAVAAAAVGVEQRWWRRGGSGGGGGGAGRGSAPQRSGSGGGQRQQQQPAAAAAAFSGHPPASAAPAGVAIFDLDFDAILAAMYAVTISDEGTVTGVSRPTRALGLLAPSFETAPHSRRLVGPVAVSLADPSGGPVVAHFSTVLPCPAAPSGTLSGLYLPSFSTNLVSGADLQDAGVHQFTPAGQRGTHCSDAHIDGHLATFSRRPGSSLYTLTTESPPVPASGQVAASGQVFGAASRSGPESAPCSCRLLSHETLLWHHRLGHPSLPRLRGMASRVLVSGLPRSLPPLPSGPGPSCVPCVEGRLRATLTPPSFPRQRLLCRRFTWTCGAGPRPWTGSRALLPAGVRGASAQPSPQGLPPGDLPALLWTGKVGDASAFRVWGSRAFVRDQSVDKLSPRAAPCVFLGFPLTPQGGSSTTPPLVVFCSPRTPPSPLGSCPFRGADSGGAESGGAEPGGIEPGGAEPGGAEPGAWGADSGGAARVGAEPGGAEPGGAAFGAAQPGGVEPAATGPPLVASGGAGPGGSPGVSSRREPLSPHELREWFARRWRRTAGARASSAAEGAGAAGPGAAGPAGPPGAGAAEDVGPETTTVRSGGGLAAGAAGVAGGPAAGGAVGAGAAGGAEGAGAVPAVSGAAARPRPYFVPLLQQVLGLPTLLECPPPVQSQSQLPPASPLPSPSPYTGPTGGLVERLGLSRAASLLSRVSLLLSSLTPFESTAASALVAELVDFAARCRLNYSASLVAESASVCPPSVRGECALGTDVLEDKQEEFQCLAAASPHLASVLLAPEGDLDALDIPTPRSYAEAVEGPYSSQWQAAMDGEMASWKSTGTYVDAVPPPGANIVSGMWIFRVKRPPGSPPVFKARYVARGFSQRQGVDYFQTFSPTPKMTTLRVLLHIAAQRDYELHSLDFSTAFLQGSLHEEIWLRRPRGFTGTFPPGT
ncbi:unnamed protein product [Closterium sp. NIES-64]|nr:unnamed protein product [Closterium sp. NIES-64]